MRSSEEGTEDELEALEEEEEMDAEAVDPSKSMELGDGESGVALGRMIAGGSSSRAPKTERR